MTILHRLGIPLALVIATGCVHRSPDQAVLRPVAAELEQLVDGDPRVSVVSYGDPLTESAFRLRQIDRFSDGHNARPNCPGEAVQTHSHLWNTVPPVYTVARGYQIRATVEEVTGDSAVVAVQRLCLRHDVPFVTAAHVLVVRQSGRWRFAKIIGGFEEQHG